MGFSRKQNILDLNATGETKPGNAIGFLIDHTDHTYLMTQIEVKDATNRLATWRSMAVLSEKPQKEKRDVRKDLEEHHTKMLMLNAALGKAISLMKKTSISNLNNLIASATIGNELTLRK